MSGVASAIVGGAVVGAAATTMAANKSAKASKSATNATIAEQQRQYDQTRADTANLRALSDQSVANLSRLQSGDMSGFYASPDYQFNLTQGQQAIDRSAVARGGLLSGAAVKAGERYASGLASQQFGSYVDRLLQSAGLGNTGIGMTSSAGQNAANNIGNAYMTGAANRANAYGMQAAGINNAVQGAASNFLLMKYLGTGGR